MKFSYTITKTALNAKTYKEFCEKLAEECYESATNYECCPLGIEFCPFDENVDCSKITSQDWMKHIKEVKE